MIFSLYKLGEITYLLATALLYPREKSLKSESWNSTFPLLVTVTIFRPLCSMGELATGLAPALFSAGFSIGSRVSPPVICKGVVDPGSATANSFTSSLLKMSDIGAALDCNSIVPGPWNRTKSYNHVSIRILMGS